MDSCWLSRHRFVSLQWRHNGRGGVSNHQPHHCLLDRLFKEQIKEISKLRVTGLCAGTSPVTGEFPAQMASNGENGSIWWRHHVLLHNPTSYSCQTLRGTPYALLIIIWMLITIFSCYYINTYMNLVFNLFLPITRTKAVIVVICCIMLLYVYWFHAIMSNRKQEKMLANKRLWCADDAFPFRLQWSLFVSYFHLEKRSPHKATCLKKAWIEKSIDILKQKALPELPYQLSSRTIKLNLSETQITNTNNCFQDVCIVKYYQANICHFAQASYFKRNSYQHPFSNNRLQWIS